MTYWQPSESITVDVTSGLESAANLLRQPAHSTRVCQKIECQSRKHGSSSLGARNHQEIRVSVHLRSRHLASRLVLEDKAEDVRPIGFHLESLIHSIGGKLDRGFCHLVDGSRDQALDYAPEQREVLEGSGDAGVEDLVEDPLQPGVVVLGF